MLVFNYASQYFHNIDINQLILVKLSRYIYNHNTLCDNIQSLLKNKLMSVLIMQIN